MVVPLVDRLGDGVDVGGGLAAAMAVANPRTTKLRRMEARSTRLVYGILLRRGALLGSNRQASGKLYVGWRVDSAMG
jgi:hypothetical protein